MPTAFDEPPKGLFESPVSVARDLTWFKTRFKTFFETNHPDGWPETYEVMDDFLIVIVWKDDQTEAIMYGVRYSLYRKSQLVPETHFYFLPADLSKPQSHPTTTQVLLDMCKDYLKEEYGRDIE